MVFNITLGFNQLENSQASDDKSKIFALLIGDTVVVNKVRYLICWNSMNLDTFILCVCVRVCVCVRACVYYWYNRKMLEGTKIINKMCIIILTRYCVCCRMELLLS